MASTSLTGTVPASSHKSTPRLARARVHHAPPAPALNRPRRRPTASSPPASTLASRRPDPIRRQHQNRRPLAACRPAPGPGALQPDRVRQVHAPRHQCRGEALLTYVLFPHALARSANRPVASAASTLGTRTCRPSTRTLHLRQIYRFLDESLG